MHLCWRRPLWTEGSGWWTGAHCSCAERPCVWQARAWSSLLLPLSKLLGILLIEAACAPGPEAPHAALQSHAYLPNFREDDPFAKYRGSSGTRVPAARSAHMCVASLCLKGPARLCTGQPQTRSRTAWSGTEASAAPPSASCVCPCLAACPTDLWPRVRLHCQQGLLNAARWCHKQGAGRLSSRESPTEAVVMLPGHSASHALSLMHLLQLLRMGVPSL